MLSKEQLTLQLQQALHILASNGGSLPIGPAYITYIYGIGFQIFTTVEAITSVSFIPDLPFFMCKITEQSEIDSDFETLVFNQVSYSDRTKGFHSQAGAVYLVSEVAISLYKEVGGSYMGHSAELVQAGFNIVQLCKTFKHQIWPIGRAPEPWRGEQPRTAPELHIVQNSAGTATSIAESLAKLQKFAGHKNPAIGPSIIPLVGEDSCVKAEAGGRTIRGIVDAAVGHIIDRAETYDKPQGERSANQVARAFNAVRGAELLTEADVWQLLQILKLVRLNQNRSKVHTDSLEDNIAYGALLAECLEQKGFQ